MPLIVVMEDDAGTRMLVASVLRKDGCEVLLADDGLSGLALVRQHKPELVISDIKMPSMDGFAMLQALRADPAIFATPVILLTSLQERAHMRIGMTSGADDYITKPFRPCELRQAAAAQLNKRHMRAMVQTMAVEAAVEVALEDQKYQLSRLYEQRLIAELSDRWPAADASSEDEKFSNATVLFVDVLNYAGFAEKLSTAEFSDVIRRFYNYASDTVHLFGARHLQFVGDGLLVVFVGSIDTASVNHGLRAARTALGLIDVARPVQQFLDSHFPTRGLPRFDVSVALNSGPVALAKLNYSLHGSGVHILPVGDTVSATLLLQKQANKVGWRIAASVAMLRGVTGAVKIGGRALISLPGRTSAIDAAELLGLAL